MLGGIAAAAITGAAGAWTVTRQSRVSMAEKIAHAEAEIRKWQADTIEHLRVKLENSENKNVEAGKRCDERIDYQRKRYDIQQDKYDEEMKKLRETNERILSEFADYRVVSHDLRNELQAFKLSLMPGGRRKLDPPAVQGEPFTPPPATP